MTETVFVDTNVLVYARDSTEAEKQVQAEEWMHFLWQRRAGRLSHQVLREFYVTVTRKLEPGLSIDEARSDVRSLLTWEPSPLDGRALEMAWAIQDRHRLSWWDSLIVAAARLAGCRYLLTEDLQHDRNLDGLQILDPFRAPPDVLALP